MKKPLLLAAALGLTSAASAATFAWDTSATAGIQDGAGAWDTSTAKWTTDGGATDVAYGNAITDAVIIGSGGAGGTITVGTVNANALTFGTTITSGYTLSGGTITLSGTTPTITNNNTAFATTISSVLTGSAGLVKSGAGTLILSGTNTFTGGTLISQGRITAGSTGALGSGAIQLGDTNTGSNNIAFYWTPTANNQTVSNAITVNNLGTGTVTIGSTGPNSFQNVTISGALTLNRATTLESGTSDRLNFSGVISGTVGTLTIAGTNGGRVVFNNGTGNSFIGNVVINSGGWLQLGVGSASSASLITDTADVTVTGRLSITHGNETINALNGAGAVDNNGVAGLKILSVGSANGSGTFSGIISGAANIGLTKLGSGTQTLSGANTYTGATTVTGGTLALAFDGATTTNRISASSALTLGGGTLSLTGTNTGAATQTVNGITTVANTGSRLLLDANRTLTLGALTAAGAGSALNFNTAAGGADASASTLGTSLIKLTGQTAGNVINTGFTVTDATGFGLATVDASNNVVRLTTGSSALAVSGGASPTNYVVNAASSNLTLTTTATQSAGSITVDTTGGSGSLTIGTGLTLNNSVWNFGAASGTNAYTITGGTLASATSGGSINFNNYSPGTLTIGSVIADNTTAGAVTFGGTGTTILTAANTYTGGATISGGTVQIGAGALGSGSSTTAALSATGTVNIVSGGKLIYNRAGTTAYANSILSGAGAVEFYGRNNGTTGGTLDQVNLNDSSTGLSGTMLVSGIRAQVNNTGDLGSATVTVNPTGQIYFQNANTYANNFIISGTGWGESAGLLGIFRLSGTTLSGSITLAGDSLIGTHGSSGTLSGVIGETGGARKLTLGGGSSGTTTLTLNGTNTYTGGTDLGMGSQSAAITANIGNNFAFGTGTVTVRDSATVASSGAARTLANNFAVNSGKTLTLSGAGGQLTLNGAIANGTGAGNLTVSAGTVRLAGANTYTGTTTVTGGSLIFGNRTAFYNNTPASWTETNLVVNSGATAAFAVGGAGEFSASDIDTLATLGTASGGFKSGAILGFDTTNATGGFTYASVIANPNGGANALGIAKFGANTLTLSGNNTYTGPVTVNGGTLLLSGTNAYTGATTVNGGGTLQVGGTIANTASITLNGNTAGLTILNGGSMTTVGALSLTTAGGNILTVNTGGTLAVGSISNPWGATYTIDGSMSVAGTWVISSNTNTSVSGAGTITADIINLGNSSTGFNYSGTGSLTVANKLTTSATTNGANSFTQSSGTVNLGGLQLGSAAMGTSNTQTFNLNGGRLNLGASGITSEGTGSRVINLGAGTLGARADWSSSLAMALTVASGPGTTFNTLDAADGVTARTIALSGILSGSGALTKAGAGTLTLSGANNYAGGTTVTAGTLAAGHVGALGTGAVSVSGGTLQIGATNLAGIASLAVDAGTLNTAAGSVSTTGAFTLAGGTWVLGDAADGVTAGSFTLTAGLIDLSGFTNRSTAGTYSLISGTGTSAFSDANFTNGDAGFSYSIDGNGDLVVTAVPEPSTYGLIGASLLAALAFVRRRRKAA